MGEGGRWIAVLPKPDTPPGSKGGWLIQPRWGWRRRKSQGCGQQGSEGDWWVPVGAWRDGTGVSGAEEEGRKGGGWWWWLGVGVRGTARGSSRTELRSRVNVEVAVLGSPRP